MPARRIRSRSALLGRLLIVTTAIHVPVMALGGSSVAAPAAQQHHHSSNRTPSPSHHTNNQCCDFCSVMCSAPPVVPSGAVVDRPPIQGTGRAELTGTGLQSVEAPSHLLPFSIGPPSRPV